MKKIVSKLLLIAFSLVLVAACNKGGTGDGDLNDPFGGGGGGNNSALVGSWTSVSATGTVGYTVYPSLATAVNADMASFILNDIVVMKFDANGKVSVTDMGQPYAEGTYTFSNGKLTVKNADNETIVINLTMNGNEFTTDAAGTDIPILIAWAIGDKVLATNGYGGMYQAGVQVSAANLVIKFRKK